MSSLSAKRDTASVIPCRKTPDRRSRAPRPYALRPVPDDFRVAFIEGGWFEVELRYGARLDVLKRWIEECGGDELRQARAAHLADKRSRRARYVMGRTLRRVG